MDILGYPLQEWEVPAQTFDRNRLMRSRAKLVVLPRNTGHQSRTGKASGQQTVKEWTPQQYSSAEDMILELIAYGWNNLEISELNRHTHQGSMANLQAAVEYAREQEKAG